MGDRYELLARARRILADPELDGVVASSDVLEDLVFLNYLERKQSGRSFLDGRLLVGSMNRGGIAGTVLALCCRSWSQQTRPIFRDVNFGFGWRA
jgi:hypothetical protein